MWKEKKKKEIWFFSFLLTCEKRYFLTSLFTCGKGRDCLPISLPNGHPAWKQSTERWKSTSLARTLNRIESRLQVIEKQNANQSTRAKVYANVIKTATKVTRIENGGENTMKKMITANMTATKKKKKWRWELKTKSKKMNCET